MITLTPAQQTVIAMDAIKTQLISYNASQLVELLRLLMTDPQGVLGVIGDEAASHLEMLNGLRDLVEQAAPGSMPEIPLELFQINEDGTVTFLPPEAGED